MTAFLDQISQAFTSLGIHPVLGAFLVGVLLVLALRRRRLPASIAAGVATDGESGPGMFTKSVVRMEQAQTSVTVDGRTVDLDAAAMAAIAKKIRSGDKIEAIKLVREKTGLGLAEAKHLVEALASSPLA